MTDNIFIVDCPTCKAKVAATETGRADYSYYDDEASQPYSERLHVGNCPKCRQLIAGHSRQTHFESFDSEYDIWSDVVRVYPKPPKTFSSFRIPSNVTISLAEADSSLQANASIAACVMFGRALEALCRDVLFTIEEKKAMLTGAMPKKRIMLGQGIREMRDKKIIDDRLYDWSQHLQAFRNIAAHPDDDPGSIARQDAEDLQAFVYAIVEYVYDLTDRYEDFKYRQEQRKISKAKTTADMFPNFPPKQ